MNNFNWDKPFPQLVRNEQGAWVVVEAPNDNGMCACHHPFTGAPMGKIDVRGYFNVSKQRPEDTSMIPLETLESV